MTMKTMTTVWCNFHYVAMPMPDTTNFEICGFHRNTKI